MRNNYESTEIDENCSKTSSQEYELESEELLKSRGEKPREINITALDYGYLVRVGCNSIAVETTEKLLHNLTLYIQDPNKYEREFKHSNQLK